MAYEEPGVKVIQQLQLEAANIQDATQAPTFVGELYEVFEDEVHSLPYDPTTGAGAQAFAWPGKKTSSVVDLAGVRKTIAEVDDQLNEFAPYPLAWKLRDPNTNAVFDINAGTDVFGLNQTQFQIVEQASAATPRASGALASASVNREFHLSAGGLISAGVVAGDRVYLTNGATSSDFVARGNIDRVHDDNVFFTPDGYDFAITAALTANDSGPLVADVVGDAATLPDSGILAVGSGSTYELIAYSAVAVAGDQHTFTLSTSTVFAHGVGDTVAVEVMDSVRSLGSGDDGDLVTNPGFLVSAGVIVPGDIGNRLALWVEEKAVTDGSATGSDNVISIASMSLDSTHVGRKLSIWSEDAGDGAVALSDISVSGTTVTANVGTPFTAAQVGDYIKIDAAQYRRIAAYTSPTEVEVDSSATGTNVTGTVYGQVVRRIMAVQDDGSVTVDDATLTAGTGLPVVLHRPVYRDLVEDDDNTTGVDIRYSGSAVSGDVGPNKQVPWEIFAADLTYEIYPAYELLVTYRALDESSVNGELAVYAASDLTALGGVSPANPLAWAAQTALVAMGTSDTLIILQPVDLYPDDDPGDKSGYPEDQDEVLGYLGALEILARNDAVYYMVPLTQNSTVRDSFVSHVLAMSAPEEKSERVCYLSYALPVGEMESVSGIIEPGLDVGNKKILDVGQDFLALHNIIPGNEVVIQSPAAYAGTYVVAAGSTDDELVLEGDNWGQDENGDYLTTTPEFEDAAADTSTGGEILSTTDNQWKDVEAGDYVYHPGDGVTRKILTVESNGGLLYAKLTYDGPDLPTLAAAQTVSILRTSVAVNYYARPLDKTGQANALAAISQARGNRRVVHMWPDQVGMITGTDAQGNDVEEYLPSYYAAAAEAGRDGVMPVQRSSTGLSLGGFTSLRNSNFYFNKTQLNTIAGGGWTILEQRVNGAPITVRHLLTTDMSTVKTQELSFTKNVDNMAKVKRASVEPLLNDENGRINITQQFLTALAFPLQGIMEQFVSNEQLVKTETADPYKILSITQDQTAPDTILEDVEMNVPLPANKATVTFII